jgi:predicted dehydrogenase
MGKKSNVRGDGKVRYAVIGAGNIAQVAILPAFKHAQENSELVALISGDATKRAALRKQYDLELDGDYADLEDILERGQIDAVYVTTPNTLHREHTLRAAARKVHVLCEKPLATSVEDCEAMAEACAENGVQLMVAYRLHFEEATLSAIELVQSGKIGRARVFDSVFTHVVRAGDIRNKDELGGGAVYDLGVYCINAARNLFRAEPISVFATVIEKDGVDETTTAVLRFPKGEIAQFTVSNGIAGVSSYRIAGTDGDLRLEPAYEYAEGLTHHLTIDEKTTTKNFAKRDQFAPELVYFSRCILEDHEPEPSADEGICDIRVVEAILESGKSGRVVELEPRQRKVRPGLEQEIHKPALAKPKTTKAPSPSVK